MKFHRPLRSFGQPPGTNWIAWLCFFGAILCIVAAIKFAGAGERFKVFSFAVSTANADQNPDLAPGDYGYSAQTGLTNNIWHIEKCEVSFAGAGVTGISVLLCDRTTVTNRVAQCRAALTAASDGAPVTQTAQHYEYRYWPPILYRPAASPGHSLTLGFATFGATATGQTITCWGRPDADL